MTDKIVIFQIENDFSVDDFNHPAWQKAPEVLIEKYWSGENAPAGRHVKAKLLWSASALYIYFEANQTEPLIISENANLNSKTCGLWERDVCEIFVAPNSDESRKYFEFEIAPNGEWIDLGIHQMPDKRETDWDYNSKMQSAARIDEEKVLMALRIEWSAFGHTPQFGDVWKGNLFRCVGSGTTRGYLAWSPTATPQPSFHVPEKFGEFEFVK